MHINSLMKFGQGSAFVGSFIPSATVVARPLTFIPGNVGDDVTIRLDRNEPSVSEQWTHLIHAMIGGTPPRGHAVVFPKPESPGG